MNALEIEEAISNLADQPFDPKEFPYSFLEGFDNKKATIKRLRSSTGSTNKSDLGGVLQTNNIHIKTCDIGDVTRTLVELRESPATAKAKAKFILATDGVDLEAEDLNSGETVACAYKDLSDRFGFFLPLARISTVKQIRDSAFDIKATSRLNKLYIELLRNNPDWGTADRRHDMNHFMARLIFCFFAEDTDIFGGENLFTSTIETMSERDASNTHEVISELFRAMDTKIAERDKAKIPRWADKFPYVNGGLFSDDTEAPKFSKIARSYLLHVGNLDWTKINPDIFGSMIQAVSDEEERGALGMHYTSVSNILKVLNPLFLDDLREQLNNAGDNSRKLLNVRNRLQKIRVFDPACGSGNFLVIAYKEMRAIESEINERRGERDRRTVIPLTNFRGIELRDFPSEIARLALIIAEYQCDVLYRGQKEALQEFLPLEAMNWITCGNALRLDWLSICPPTGTVVKVQSDDLFESALDQAEIDFENEGGETYICGNPPYLGSKWQTEEQKEELGRIFDKRVKGWKSLDYVSGWFMKAADYAQQTSTVTAFVATNSICQGQQVPILWPEIFKSGHHIEFAHTSFKWSNLASHNAGVTVAIIAISNSRNGLCRIFSSVDDGTTTFKAVPNINAYLVSGPNVIVTARSQPPDERAVMQFGNHPYYGAGLIFPRNEAQEIIGSYPEAKPFIRPLYGSKEFISASPRACIWVREESHEIASAIPPFNERFRIVEAARKAAKKDKAAQKLAETPYRFRDQIEAKNMVLVVPRVSSENRMYLPVGVLPGESIIQDQAFALQDAELWNMALIVSRIHLTWVTTVCGKMKTDFRYSNTLGWNTFPIPKLTEKNKADLTRSAEEILLARESHFPMSIAELYDPVKMPGDLKDAHDRNDEMVERIYIGRRFRNDTERLEKLFELHIKMTSIEDKQSKEGSTG